MNVFKEFFSLSYSNTTLSALKKEFKNLNKQDAVEIDKAIKSELAKEEMTEKNISELLKKNISSYLDLKKDKGIDQKCDNLAKIYLNNNSKWLLGENLFCLLAYVYSIISLIESIYIYNSSCLDWANFIALLLIFVLWFVFLKRIKNKCWNNLLLLFNRYAPTVIMFTYIVFYFFKAVTEPSNCCLLMILIISLVALSILVYFKYEVTYKSDNQK